MSASRCDTVPLLSRSVLTPGDDPVGRTEVLAPVEVLTSVTGVTEDDGDLAKGAGSVAAAEVMENSCGFPVGEVVLMMMEPFTLTDDS